MGARPPNVHARGMRGRSARHARAGARGVAGRARAGRACTQSSAVSEASASAKTMCEATCQEESRRSCTSTDFGASAALASSPASAPAPTSVTVSTTATEPASATGCAPFAATRGVACWPLSMRRRKPYLLASTAASASALASASASVSTSAFAHNGWASCDGCRLRRRRARCAIMGTSMPSTAPRSSRPIAATAAAAAASAAASAASTVSDVSGASATAASSTDEGWPSGSGLPHGPAPSSTRDERWSWPSWVNS